MVEKPAYHLMEQRITALEKTIAELSEEKAILENRLATVTRSLDIKKDLQFEDLFNIEDIQKLQDQFAEATGVASLITTPDGKPITTPSNFCRLCRDLIRKNETGRLNCYQSDAEIGRLNLDGPTIKTCLSGGLWDSGAGISIGGLHLANWLMGQVRDERQGEDNIRAYARKIGIGEEETVQAFYEVPSMSREQYKRISDFLFTLANQLSQLAYQNAQQVSVIKELERSKESLRQSEAHHRTLIETIPDLVWVKDSEGRYLGCNHQFERFFGAKESDITGKTDYDYVDSEQAAFFRHYDRKAIEKDGPSVNEEWLSFSGIDYRGVFETIKTPLKDGTGNLIGVLGIARDITKIKEKEQELRQIFDMSLDMICIADLETTRFTKVNPAFKRILGYTEKELLTRSFFDFLHPEDVEGMVRVIKDSLLKGKKVIKFDNRYLCKDGSITWLSWVSHPQPETNLTFAIGRDITEERAVSRALSESEQRFRSIVESSPMGILIYELQTNEELILIGVNDAATQILDLDCNRLVGLPIERAFPKLAETEVPTRYREICRNGSSWHQEQIDYQDQWIKGAYDVHAFQTSANRVAVTFLDITDRLKIDQEKKNVQEKLFQSQKMDAIGQLAGGIAHDFNNMLSGIKGATELLEMVLGDNERAAKYIQIIHKATDRTSALIGKLLAFGRKGKQLSSPVDVHTILEDAVAILERSIDKRIQIETVFEASHCEVTGDPAQLQNCFLNLFINARDAMPDGGLLKISTGNIEIVNEPVAEGDLLPGEYLLVSVQDSGDGIPPEVRPHIFEPFFTTKETGKGTGLGLAAVYGIVKDHHGDIAVHSDPGGGTGFEIFLATSLEPVNLSDRSRGDMVHGSGTILLVDDEDIIRSTGTYILEQLGYDVLLADDGQRAVQMYRANMATIDLVILDIVMPVMDGRQAYRAIRSVNPDVKVIISSGFTKDVSMADMLEDGLAGFIMKPFSSSELSRLVAESLGT